MNMASEPRIPIHMPTPPPNTPPYATLISRSSSQPAAHSSRGRARSPSSRAAASPSRSPGTSSKPFNLSQLMLSGLTSSPVATPSSPRAGQSGSDLLTTRAPLSIPTTTVNFRRFVGRSSVIWWMQDRIEEVIMWRRGWKVTAAWMAGYAFLCYYPRMILLLPHAGALCLLLSSYMARNPLSVDDTPSPPYTLPIPSEGSSEWYANLQAIQNLMGFASDAYDVAVPLIPYFTHSSPYSLSITRVLLLSFLLLAPAIVCLPLRPLFITAGLAPFVFTHPSIRALISHPLASQVEKYTRWALERVRNEDALSEKHWLAREGGEQQWGAVETWEREVWRLDGDANRWCAENARGPWEVALVPGSAFVETEDWVVDLLGAWSGVGADADGWVYTDASWQRGVPLPLRDGEVLVTTTRRRRWTRRIYRALPPTPTLKPREQQ